MEIARYAIDLRAFSHGAATFTRTGSRATSRCRTTSPRRSRSERSRGRRGCSASALRERRCASQCWTSSSYAGWPISSTSSARVGDVDRLRADVRLGVAAEQYQSRSCPPGPQPRRSYSAMRDLGVAGAVGQLDVAEGAPDRQLPADVGLGLDEVHAGAEREPVQGAARAAREAGPVEEDAGALVDRGLAVALVVGLDPGVLAAGVVELPVARGRALRRTSATRFSSSSSEKCAPSVQQPSSGRSA